MSGVARRVGGHPDLPAAGYEEDPMAITERDREDCLVCGSRQAPCSESQSPHDEVLGGPDVVLAVVLAALTLADGAA
jgi:hypothetical protein